MNVKCLPMQANFSCSMAFYLLILILLFSVAITFGDPHIVTLDGVEYTFNGYGEYDILQVDGPEFKLQGRMKPLVDEHGKTTRATVYRAFALKENSSDILQVMICEISFKLSLPVRLRT